ncbi:hypothetical protein BN906_02069 [Clostridium tetani 12124569]|nr:hypothetical protein BN906_02069 [Clostridium tetani 12124569]
MEDKKIKELTGLDTNEINLMRKQLQLSKFV